MSDERDPTEFTIEWHIGDLHLFAEYRWHVDHDEPEIKRVSDRDLPKDLLPIINDRTMFDLLERARHVWRERHPAAEAEPV